MAIASATILIMPLPARTEFVTVETRLRALRCAEARYPPRLAIQEHVHQKASITLILNGSFVEAQGRVTKADCRAGTAIFRRAGEPHANFIGQAGARNLEIELTPELAASCDFDSVRRSIVHNPALATLGRRMRTELEICDRARPWLVEGIALEIMGLGLRLRDVREAKKCPSWLRRVRERLESDVLQDYGLQALAESEGVHPVHLARAFRSHYGMSPGAFLRARRIARAADSLTDKPHLSVTEVALEAGFFDHSHFARAFKSATGLSPSAYRRAGHPRGQRLLRTRA